MSKNFDADTGQSKTRTASSAALSSNLERAARLPDARKRGGLMDPVHLTTHPIIHLSAERKNAIGCIGVVGIVSAIGRIGAVGCIGVIRASPPLSRRLVASKQREDGSLTKLFSVL